MVLAVALDGGEDPVAGGVYARALVQVDLASSSTSSMAELTKRFMIAGRPPVPQPAWRRAEDQTKTDRRARRAIPTLIPRRRFGNDGLLVPYDPGEVSLRIDRRSPPISCNRGSVLPS